MITIPMSVIKSVALHFWTGPFSKCLSAFWPVCWYQTFASLSPGWKRSHNLSTYKKVKNSNALVYVGCLTIQWISILPVFPCKLAWFGLWPSRRPDGHHYGSGFEVVRRKGWLVGELRIIILEMGSWKRSSRSACSWGRPFRTVSANSNIGWIYAL